MYKRSRKGWLKHIDFILLDLLCLTVSYILAHLLRHGTASLIINNQAYTNVWLMLMVFDLLIMVLAETMHNVIKRGFFKEFAITLRQDALLFGAITIFLFTVKDGDQVSRIVLWMTMGLHIVTSYLVRLGWKRHLVGRQAFVAHQSMLMIVDKDKAQQTMERFKKNSLESINITGIVIADEDLSGTEIEGIPVVCSLGDAPKYICRKWIDEVFISTATPPLELIERCSEMGVTTHRMLHSAGNDRQFVEKIAGAYVVTNTMNTMTSMQMFLKRAMDILGGLIGSLVALIVMAIVGPRIKRESPGPILFKQERIGQSGKRFKMYKIRSMVMNADEKKKEYLAQNRVSDGMMFKLDFDPRIIGNKILPDGTHKTGIGEFIRNTSLDEFPQFFNVLMGQMSLVGTRPPTVDEWEKYEYHHRARLAIKPGLTGMWQISGRSGITDFEEVVKLDTEYINHWSLGLDIKILLKTIVKVIKRDGAM